MTDSASIPSTSSADATPASCPACQSPSIVTIAKSPDADSYWCTSCGEAWNLALPGAEEWRAPMAATRTGAVRDLLELIAALDRRIPQVQRAGETAIARDAATLKARAVKRIEELERESSVVESP